MTGASIGVATGCVLVAAEARFAVEGEQLREELRLEILARRGCDRLRLDLPQGSVVGSWRAHERRGDGTRVRLDAARLEVAERAADGSGSWTLHLPDLLAGDRVFLRAERLHPAVDLEWEAPPAERLELSVEGATLEGATGGALSRAPAQDPTTARILLGRAAERPARLPAGIVSAEEHLSLLIPEGDPQLSLYPGGGSSARVERFLRFAPAAEERVWPLDAPPDREVLLRAEPEGVASLESDQASHRLVLAPSDAPARVTVAWEQPDAPAHGERAPELDRLVVTVAGGEIAEDPAGWALVRVHDRVVLPGREALVRALDRRFRYASMPEPGAPMELRGQEPGWDLAAALRPALTQRTPVGSWPSDPLFPRPLLQARRSGVVTPLEGALTLWLMARQLRLEADWALVRPASAGPASPLSPSGHTRPVVRIEVDGEIRWVDPSCAVCAPFELPPDLEDADALGPGVERTGPSTPGRLEVTLRGEELTWVAEGPPALLLRLRLEELPAEDRARALVGMIAGPGATLVSVEGLEQAGAPVRVTARAGGGLVPDPTLLPAPGPDGSAWMEWVGVRSRISEGSGPTGRWEASSATLERSEQGGLTVTRLEVRSRRIPAEDLGLLQALPPTAPDTGAAPAGEGDSPGASGTGPAEVSLPESSPGRP